MSEVPRFFAHTLEGQPPDEWEELHAHLQAVADRASEFAERLGFGEWAHLAGLWHDVGKYSAAFQAYLGANASPDPHAADQTRRVDHSTAGAQHAVATDAMFGQLLAYVIAGHHSGLLDWRRDGACLAKRLDKTIEPWDSAPNELLGARIPEPPAALRSAFDHVDRRRPFGVALFVRMLFSCLVDADYLESERFMNPHRSEQRTRWPVDVLARMSAALDEHVANFDSGSTVVHRQRGNVRRACLDAAELEPGLFSLRVPTGGGKTLSSLAFALRHAKRWGCQRVIYVAPFTTIIEQNADAFRKALRGLIDQGLEDPVVEHHSNFDVGKETHANRLATENWDAPLIVTTSVQFYESLFANRGSRCRKLHRMARSVIVLDEAQALPVDVLEPCLRALTELADAYRASIVLCTATQPAVEQRPDFPIGLKGVHKIIQEPEILYKKLERVEVRDLGRLDDPTLVQRLANEDRALCIVNTRGHARRLFEQLGEAEGSFHLSALMCPQHRTERLQTIRDRLGNDESCRLVSTQLIEAGVDIDFPTVYRSLAGLDSIAQAAGRCNRNGTLTPAKGRLYVFRSQHIRSEAFFAETASCADQLIPLYDDPLSLRAIEHYFQLYYWEQSARWDAKRILEEMHVHNRKTLPFAFAFEEIARRFKLIEDSGVAVIIPWRKEGSTLCEELRSTANPDRRLLRRLQRYSVNIPQWLYDAHAGRSIELVHGRYPVLISPEINYCEHTGLKLDAEDTALLMA